jgi:hypothetical protein
MAKSGAAERRSLIRLNTKAKVLAAATQPKSRPKSGCSTERSAASRSSTRTGPPLR